MRRPTVSRQDIIKIGFKLKSFFKSLQQVQDNLYVMTPLVIPFHGSKTASKLNRLLLSAQVRYYQKKLNLNNPILWSFLPNTVDVVGAFEENLSIYYITDDFTQFTGYPVKAIADMKARLIDKSDVVIASAKRLVEKKSRNGKKVELVSHGVNHQHFAKVLTMTSSDWPSDIKKIKRPIIGFYGEINDWFDLRILVPAVQKRPDWSFVLLGRIAVEVGDIGDIISLPNIYYLGQKDFEDLPGYCAAFDVALIPMKLNELTLSVNPLKLREYLAAGVPVVSAPLPEVLPYGDVVKFAKTADEMIAAAEDWIKQDRGKLAPVLSRRVADESWDAEVEEISKIIEKALAAKENKELWEMKKLESKK